jgi:membrane protein DedA with SNARE-associated domain
METFTYWLSRYGYFGLFSLLMFGIVGVPIPEETLLTFSGVLVYRGHLELLPTLLAAFLGSCCGITVSYGLGRVFGLVLTTRFGRVLHVNPQKVEQVHLWFERVGHWGLLWGYFLPGIRHFTALLAGATRLRYADFALFAYAGALVWSFTFVSLGALAGRQWALVSAQVHRNLLIASGIVAALLLGALVVRQVVARCRASRS